MIAADSKMEHIISNKMSQHEQLNNSSSSSSSSSSNNPNMTEAAAAAAATSALLGIGTGGIGIQIMTTTTGVGVGCENQPNGTNISNVSSNNGISNSNSTSTSITSSEMQLPKAKEENSSSCKNKTVSSKSSSSSSSSNNDTGTISNHNNNKSSKSNKPPRKQSQKKNTTNNNNNNNMMNNNANPMVGGIPIGMCGGGGGPPPQLMNSYKYPLPPPPPPYGMPHGYPGPPPPHMVGGMGPPPPPGGGGPQHGGPHSMLGVGGPLSQQQQQQQQQQGGPPPGGGGPKLLGHGPPPGMRVVGGPMSGGGMSSQNHPFGPPPPPHGPYSYPPPPPYHHMHPAHHPYYHAAGPYPPPPPFHMGPPGPGNNNNNNNNNNSNTNNNRQTKGVAKKSKKMSTSRNSKSSSSSSTTGTNNNNNNTSLKPRPPTTTLLPPSMPPPPNAAQGGTGGLAASASSSSSSLGGPPPPQLPPLLAQPSTAGGGGGSQQPPNSNGQQQQLQQQQQQQHHQRFMQQPPPPNFLHPHLSLYAHASSGLPGPPQMPFSMGGHASNIHSSSSNNNKPYGAGTSTKRGGTSREWTKREDELLKQLVEEKGIKNWTAIVQEMPGRKESTCQRRWNKVIKPSIIKGPWTLDEDKKLLTLIAKFGAKRWSVTAQELPGRTGKQCRERWHNHLNPSICKDKAWTLEEDVLILHHQSQMGNKWSEMTKFLPGRTDNAVKNRWNSALRRKVERYLANKLGVEDSAIKPVDKEGRYEYNNTDNEHDGVDTMFQAISVLQTPKSATKKGCSQTSGGDTDNSATAHPATSSTTTTTTTGYNPFANLSMYPGYYPPPPMPGQMPFAAGYNSTSSSLNNNNQLATPQINALAMAPAASAATRHFASPYIRPIQTPNPTPRMPSTTVKSTVGRSTSRSSGRVGGAGECFSSTKKSIFDDSPSVSLGGGSLGMRLDSHSPGSSLRSLQGIMTSPPQSHSRSLMDTFSTPFPVESFPAFSYDEADSLNKSLFSDGIMTPFPKRPGATTAAFRSSSSTSSRPMMILAAIRISIGSDETVGTNIRNKKISQKVSISPISKNAWKGSFLNDDDELSQTLRSLKPAKEDDRDDADPSQETLDDHMEQADKDNNKDELDKAIMPPPTAPRVRIDDTVQIATFSNSHQKLTRLSISSSCSRNSAATTPRNLNREQGEELSSSSSSLLKAPSTVDMDRAMKDMATPSTAAMSELGGNTSFMSNEMSPVPMSLTPAATVAAASSEKKPKAAVVGDESFDLDKKELGSSSAAVAAETSSPLGNVETDNRTTTTSKRPAEADDVDLPEAKRSKQEQQQHVKQ